MNKNILILPGFSRSNLAWAQEIASKLSPQFEANIWHWKHWGSGEVAGFSAQSEAEQIITHLRGKNVNSVDVLAKSIGTLVFCIMAGDAPEFFRKVILCGIPLNDLQREDLVSYKNLDSLAKENLVCYENNADPHGSSKETQKFLSDLNLDIRLITKDRADHEYFYAEEFKQFFG